MRMCPIVMCGLHRCLSARLVLEGNWTAVKMVQQRTSRLAFVKCIVVTSAAIFAVGLLVGLKLQESVDDSEELELRLSEDVGPAAFSDEITHPIIVWWTPFTHDQGHLKTCGSHQCFFTINRNYKDHPHLKAFLFYGSDLDVGDLPVPRRPDHQWGLLHEESPKNNHFMFCHEEIMKLFNHTSTFKQQSDCPITTQYLDSIKALESKQYLKSVEEKNRLIRDEGLAIINFVQSDCDTPSDRDNFVRMLQRHVKVDSYGQCLHNKNLPEHLTNPIGGMDHTDFYRLTAKYKFTLALENAVCDDYITEKFWRPFLVGSVPIVYGSPKIKDWLPDEHSAFVVNDFSNIEEIAQLLLHLNSSDAEYAKYLKYKSDGVTNSRLLEEMKNRQWATNDWTKPNFVTNFECCVCERLHEQMKRSKEGVQLNHQASVEHYGCPKPTQFSDEPLGSLAQKEAGEWAYEWIEGGRRAQAVAQLIAENRTFSRNDVESRAYKLQYP